MIDYQAYAACNTLSDDAAGTVELELAYPLDGSLHDPNPYTRAVAEAALRAMLLAGAPARPAPRPIPCPRCHREVLATRWDQRTWLGCPCGWTLAITPRQESYLWRATLGREPDAPASLVAAWTLCALGLTVTNP